MTGSFMRRALLHNSSSIQSMLCLIEGEIEWTSQETTMLLHLFQNVLSAWLDAYLLIEPSTNSTLFFTLNAVSIERLHKL